MKNLVLFFMLISPILVFGQIGRDFYDFSFYRGNSYRFFNKNYTTYDLSYERYSSGCIYYSFNGFGIKHEKFSEENYSVSVKYFHSIFGIRRLLYTPYIAISPVLYQLGNVSGVNIKPEIGLRFSSAAFFSRFPLSIHAIASYGYDLPLTHPSEFNVGRNDLNIKIGLAYNVYKLKRKHQINKLKRKKEFELKNNAS